MKKRVITLSALSLTAALLASCAVGQSIYDQEARKVCERTDNREPEVCRKW